MRINITFAAVIIIIYSSCNRYYVSVESLRQQFAFDSLSHRISDIDDPHGNPVAYYREPVAVSKVKHVAVVDKNGVNDTLGITDRTEIRIWQNNGRKKTFYLNTLRVTDSTFSGSKTHFWRQYVKPFPFREITRIRILINP